MRTFKIVMIWMILGTLSIVTPKSIPTIIAMFLVVCLGITQTLTKGEE